MRACAWFAITICGALSACAPGRTAPTPGSTSAPPAPAIAAAPTAAQSAERSVLTAPDASPWAFSSHAEALPTEVPVVEVKGAAISVDGVPAGTTREADDAGRPRRMDEEFAALRKTRDAWKETHPGAAFPGRILLRMPRRASLIALKSVYQTAAFSGYPTIGLVVETGDGSREGVLWIPAQVPGPPTTMIGLAGPTTPPIHTLVLSANAERFATTWKDGPRVFTEDAYPRSVFVEPTIASPKTSAALLDAIRTAFTLRGVPTDPESKLPDPVEKLVISVADTEPYATLITVLDALQAFREEHPNALAGFDMTLGMH